MKLETDAWEGTFDVLIKNASTELETDPPPVVKFKLELTVAISRYLRQVPEMSPAMLMRCWITVAASMSAVLIGLLSRNGKMETAVDAVEDNFRRDLNAALKDAMRADKKISTNIHFF